MIIKHGVLDPLCSDHKPITGLPLVREKSGKFLENLCFIRGCGDQLAYPKNFGFGARVIFFNTLHSKFVVFTKFAI